jgi:hypothetical protein
MGVMGGGRQVKYGFDERLSFSRGQREASDVATLMAMIPGCVSVTKTDVEMDRRGVDYIAELRRGDQLWIDAKARDKGCSKYWKGEPEVALETWSVAPGGRYQTDSASAVVGWTLTEAKHVDLILFTFDPQDCRDAYLLSFPLLRAAFRRHGRRWETTYRVERQESDGWESECMFVPISAVFDAVNQISCSPRVIAEEFAKYVAEQGAA